MELRKTLGPFEAQAPLVSPEQFFQLIRNSPSPQTEAERWISDNLTFETVSAIRRKQQANEEKRKLKEEGLQQKIQGLKQIPDKQYQDLFNKMVCQKLDWLEKNCIDDLEKQKNKLAYAEKLIRQEISENISDGDIFEYLSRKIGEQKQNFLGSWLKQGLQFLGDPQKAISFACLSYEIEQRKNEPTWNEKKLREVVINGLRGEKVNLISMVCCINVYDYESSFGLSANLSAYKENPSLPNIPSNLDQLILFRKMLTFYGIDTDLFIYVADTEYTEVEKFGPITNEILSTLKKYVNNVRQYVLSRDNQSFVDPISELVFQDQIYQRIKKKVLNQVTLWSDGSFSQKWYKTFESYSESMSERILKRKIFPANQARQKSLDITRRRWAVNAAEGAVFSSFGKNTILVSTETRKKDQTYVIDKETEKKFPPVIYVLKI